MTNQMKSVWKWEREEKKGEREEKGKAGRREEMWKRREMWALSYFPSLLSARIRNHLPTLWEPSLLLFRAWVWRQQSFRKPWHWRKAVCLQFTNKIISIQFLSVTSHSGCFWAWNLRAVNIQDQFSLMLSAAFLLDCLLRRHFPFVLCLGPECVSPFYLLLSPPSTWHLYSEARCLSCPSLVSIALTRCCYYFYTLLTILGK